MDDLLMPRRRVRQGGHDLTPLGFGGGPIGWATAPDADAQSQEIVTAAWEHGIRYFDTAAYFGFGAGETRLGRTLGQVSRDSFVL